MTFPIHLLRRPSGPALSLALALAAAGSIVVVANVGDATPSIPSTTSTPPLMQIGGASGPLSALPAPLVEGVRPLDPEAAMAVNQATPVASGANPPAAPFTAVMTVQDRQRAIECLANAIYYEAGREPEQGQRAVAQVVLNRVRHPAFPANVCAVVFEGSTRRSGCQFTFTCDGAMAYSPMRDAWDRARRIAADALSGSVYAPVGQATHYHADYVVPYWSMDLAKVDVVGRHLFYRWGGSWGTPAAFSQRYAGREAAPSLLRQAALSAAHDLPSALMPDNAEVVGDAPTPVVVERSGKDRKVIARFLPEMRAASDKVAHTAYVERVGASDNLRYALGDDSKAAEAPLGRLDSSPAPGHSPAP